MTKAHLASILAFSLWGLFPLYWKLFSQIDSWTVFSQRVLWSFLSTFLILFFQKKLPQFLLIFRDTRKRLLLIISSILIASNWLLYIYAVQTGQVLEASMGYFLNPLFNIIFGALFLKEKMRWGQWPSVILVIIAITYMSFKSDFAHFPWIALSLSLTFAFYGIIRKLTLIGAMEGLCFETLVMVFPVLFILWIWPDLGVKPWTLYESLSWTMIFLFSLSGLVTTAPLVLFAHSAKRLKLQTMAFIQYLSPTLKFLCGLLIFHEPLKQEMLQSFVIIWMALLWYTGESLVFVRSQKVNLVEI